MSGTIGGSVEELKLTRFMTDLIYFIFFGLLFGNIVSGIMIDTFAELRAKREEMQDDKKNKCYICGRSRGEVLIFLCSCKRIMKNLRNISKINISFGIIFIICIVFTKRTRRNTQVYNMRFVCAWMQAKMNKIT